MSSSSQSVYYLDCPFSEKDEAKSLGAKWDDSAKKWFVPREAWATSIHLFNRWRPATEGRIFLNCPFADKDQAKTAGAKWDANTKHWYITENQLSSSSKFSKWLSNTDLEKKKTSESSSDSPKKPPPPQRRRGNAQDATRLRITETMTIPQLREECRFRGIKGFSGKNKDWLLQQLGIGSLWQSSSTATSSSSSSATVVGSNSSQKQPSIERTKEAKPPKKSSSKQPSDKKSQGAAKKKEVAADDTKKKAAPKKQPTKSSPKTKTTAAVSKAAPKISKQAPKSKKAIESHAVTKTTGTTTMDWMNNMPRISSALTIAQLSHELLHRDPTVKGISNKSKAWFVTKLGDGSIWTSSPEASTIDFSNIPRVSPKLTMAQLVHELLARSLSIKGLSTKSKDDLLTLTGVGSIWTTGVAAAAHNNNASAIATPATSSKKNTTSKSSKTDSGSTAKSKSVAVIASKKKATVKPAPTKKSTSGTIKSATKVKVVKTTKEAAEKKSMVSVGSSKVKKEKAAKMPAAIPAAVRSSSVAAVSMKVKKETAMKPPTVPPSCSSLAVASSQTEVSPKKRAPTARATAPTVKRIKQEDAVPIVSSSMTVTELKDEIRIRDPKAKGLSKGKDSLLARLGIGTERRGSAEYMAKVDAQAAKLHVHKSLCHQHALADSSLLRAPPASFGFGIDSKRVHVAVCNVRHHYICQKSAYRTCEQCNYDICQPCYEIESLPPQQRETKLNQRLYDLAQQDAARQRQWEEEEQARETRRLKEEERYEQQRQERMYDTYGEELKRFPDNVRNPSAKNTDETKKLKYTVWTCDVHRKQTEDEAYKEFDSSFAALKDANLRVEFVFYYKNPWGCDKDEMYADVDKELRGGLRYMRSEPDGGGSYSVSVLPSDAFDFLQPHDNSGHDFFSSKQPQEPRPQRKFPSIIRNPTAKHMENTKLLQYTVWTSCGYDYDGWHSYAGPPEKEFNSSYSTLEEANERAEYVFYYLNPWGLRDDELPHAETDEVDAKGFRFLECCPDDSERWTVSVIPSVAFEYINL